MQQQQLHHRHQSMAFEMRQRQRFESRTLRGRDEKAPRVDQSFVESPRMLTTMTLLLRSEQIR